MSSPASEPSVWSVNSRDDVLKGEARGISIDQNGMISLAPQLTEVFKTEQPYIWSTASDAVGNIYLGTGGDGKIFKVGSDGRGALFADTNELNVAALATGAGGELYAGTSPDGKVYRIDASGQAQIYFDPKEKYIWSLAVLADGSLAVGTGEGGKIFRVRSANASPESSLFFDASETNIISLIPDRAGNLYAGTDPAGLVLKFGPDAKPFAVLDSPLREVSELALGTDGSVYALVLGESASTPAPAAAATPAAAKTESPTVSVGQPAAGAPEPQPKSRYDLTGARSAVYRILPEGGNDILWSSPTVVGFSLYAHQTGNGVLLGTSDRGRIYNIGNDSTETLVLQSDAGQISSIRTVSGSIFAASSNQGNLYRFGSGAGAEGTYESSVLDAKATAAWGRIWWRSSGNVQISTRSGNTERADETWSQWAPLPAGQSGQIGSPNAKYLQWRAVLRSSATPATLSEVNISFLARNIAPEVLSIQILPTNVGLVANPAVQIDPNIELSGLDPAVFGVPVTAVPPRKVYQRGARSIQWTADDRNGDKLVYDIAYREVGSNVFSVLRSNIPETFFTLDGQSLPDGRYIFRITARDSPSNPAGTVLTGERFSEPIDIDNTQPIVTAFGTPQISGQAARVTFDASDASSYLARAEYSINGGGWSPVYADDGISDGPRERYTFSVPISAPGEYSITLRVFDVNGNAGNARVVVRR